MADYSEDIDATLEMISEDGAAITFRIYPEQNDPTDPDRPYLGSPVAREPYPHFALIVPLRSIIAQTESFSECALIPAKGLPFEVVQDTQFELKGLTYSISQVQRIAPDAIPILYIAEVTSWPT